MSAAGAARPVVPRGLALSPLAAAPVAWGAVAWALLTFAPVAGAGAQASVEPPAPFATMDVRLGASASVSESRTFGEVWSPGATFEGTLAFPFYLGTIEVGLEQTRHDSRRPGVPGFRSRLLFAGWGGGRRVLRRLAWTGGVRVGIYAMGFDGDSIPGFSRSESEMAVGAGSGLVYDAGGGWGVDLGARYQAVLTRERIGQLLVGVGVRRRFGTPPWLRDFLD